jgi:preprotein translocase subunit YajC
MYYALLLLAQAGQAQPEAEPANFLEALARSPLPLFLMLGVVFWLFMIRPVRRERQQRESLTNTLKKNDRVLTNAGIIGTVTNIKDEEVTLKLEEGRMRILKSTIARILSAEEPGKEQKQEPAKSS